MQTIPVTSLSSYLYCPRKLYLEKVIGLIEINQEAVTKGSIRHRCYEMINKNEEALIKSVNVKDRDQIYFIFKDQYLEYLRKAIEEYKDKLNGLGIDVKDFFEDTKKYMTNEAFDRSLNLFKQIEKNSLIGEKLWEVYEPKYISEHRINASEIGVRGIIDQIEIFGEKLVPAELKTGKAPNEGAWPGHKIQIGAYILMLEYEKKVKIDHGYVHYLDHNKKAIIRMNPFLRMEIFELIEKVMSLLNSEYLPEKVPQEGKCNACALKEKCWQLKSGAIKDDVLLQIKSMNA